jgi:putative glutamine amidotransferase
VIVPKPLIGITTSRMPNPSGGLAFGTNIPYVKSIVDAGGLPVLIPLDLFNEDLDLIMLHLDGILFTGGYDIDPHLYGNRHHPKVEGVDTGRDRVEIHLVRQLFLSGKPFFGICRGCQVINVAMSGSLYEDLPEQFSSEIPHDNHDHPRNYLAHTVDVQPNSKLASILTVGPAWVNSLHHQGVNKLGRGLKIAAVACDGLVEAFELENYPYGLAVQWHPEELQEHETMRALFQAFVKFCQPINPDPPNEGAQ